MYLKKRKRKMLKRKNNLLFLFVLLSWCLGAQSQSQPTPQDSVALPVDSFMALVERHHPLAAQARLLRQAARAARLKASGGFDPKLFSEMDNKRFDEKNYYQLQNSGLEIPGWFGLKAKAGYELNEGIYLNGQNTVPGSGLWYADVSWTLGRGLFIDERRAMLKQARLLEESAEYEIDLALNTLFENALNAYWDWYSSYQEILIYQDALKLAEFRFNAVKRAAIVGDEPFIDTLEAAIQVQDRRVSLQKTRADFIHKRNVLATYLWLEGQIPLEINSRAYPIYQMAASELFLPDNWFTEHPALAVYDLKIERLDIERRLQVEQLKPELTVNYKFLNQPAPNDFFANYSVDNYNWGLKASFPLFVRKGRGEVLKQKVKIQENQLSRDLKAQEIRNKVAALQNELRLNASQLTQIRAMVNNYRRLLQAENTKFRNGESSLFLVNSRELKYIDSRLKEIATESKLNQVQAKLAAAAGVLN